MIQNNLAWEALLQGSPAICGSSQFKQDFFPDLVFKEFVIYICKKKTSPADVSCTVTRFCHLTAAVTFRRVHHPPSPFSIALSHRCFSKLMAFFCRATFSTARFRLHRKFVRRLARSVSRGTSASGNFEKCIAFEKKCQDQQKQQ